LSRTSPEVLTRAEEAFKKLAPNKESQAEQRRNAEQKFQQWKAHAAIKAKEKRAEEAKRKQEMKEYLDEKYDKQASRADEAYEKYVWLMDGVSWDLGRPTQSVGDI
jgi:hypothetical protein